MGNKRNEMMKKQEKVEGLMNQFRQLTLPESNTIFKPRKSAFFDRDFNITSNEEKVKNESNDDQEIGNVESTKAVFGTNLKKQRKYTGLQRKPA